MAESADPQELANSACAAWLAGEALYEAMERLRRSEPEPIAAHRASEVLDELRAAVLDTCTAADQSLGAPETFDDHRMAFAEAAHERCRSTLREIARLTLGVTSQTTSQDSTAVLERAAVETLYPGDYDNDVPFLTEENVVLHSTDRAGLFTEICGVLGCALTETMHTLTFSAPGQSGAVVVDIDEDSNVLIHSPVPAEKSGPWIPEGERFAARLEAPVSIASVTSAVLEIMFDLLAFDEGAGLLVAVEGSRFGDEDMKRATRPTKVSCSPSTMRMVAGNSSNVVSLLDWRHSTPMSS